MTRFVCISLPSSMRHVQLMRTICAEWKNVASHGTPALDDVYFLNPFPCIRSARGYLLSASSHQKPLAVTYHVGETSKSKVAVLVGGWIPKTEIK